MVVLLNWAGARADKPSGAFEYGATAEVSSEAKPDPDLASSVVTRRELEDRAPSSAPDALRYEPGVSIQQTAHGQASPYLRGMTGQQVAHVFDGVRMNNGIFRQGPNQYFFTVDAHTLESLAVVRGSASTHYGSDALGGAILARPREPGPSLSGGFELHPRVFARAASVDGELGGRFELELSPREDTALLIGGGYRDVGRLTSGGLVKNPGRIAPMVPRFESDGRTQLGTGFEEATFDARLVHQLRGTVRVVAALYAYRQYDAPRTDQCPPPEAPINECLWVDTQFRTLAYLALRGDAGPVLRDFDLQVSYQQHDERLRKERPRSFVEHRFANHVYTLGAAVRARAILSRGPGWRASLFYGADAYRDQVRSAAAQELLDPALIGVVSPDDLLVQLSRGQYLDRSVYIQSGVWSELALEPLQWLSLRGGGRLAAAGANTPSDVESGSRAISERFTAAVARAGVRVTIDTGYALHFNFDQGFRAPNLDDLTSRQQVGPGFQFDNPDLVPERTETFEFGVRLEPGFVTIDAWLFATRLRHAITRATREAGDCPPATPTCRSSRTQFQLVNADADAWILGSEGAVTAVPLEGLSLRATYAVAWGEGPNTGSRAVLGRQPFGARVPVSRIPPVNGTVEARYEHRATSLYAAAAMRWALAQRRLAPTDLADARIPSGGTPGYTVFELRAGYRYSTHLRVSCVFENLLNAAYRVHGSSINGPGRGVVLSVEASY